SAHQREAEFGDSLTNPQVQGRREESFSPLHNAPNEVAGGSVIPGWALCSLFTICLMTERGLPSAPVLPNEPQREITGSI
ncbi:hypothetical protein JOQ06_024228, partial [Pogonophryne albipinna]